MDKKLDLIFRINDNGMGPELLHEVFLERGWKEYDSEVHGENGWNMWWKTSRFRTGEYNSLLSSQWINHYPNCTSITRKDSLCRNIKKMRIVHGVNVYNFSPKAFNLPNDYTKFVSEYAKLRHPKKNQAQPVMWILKPAESSRGRGIFLFSDLAELQYDCNAVIQHYISDPYLIGGYKFDVRVYVAVPSFHPLQIYIHEEGLVRFSTEKYDLLRPDNIFAHLTNTSINKYSPGYTTDKDQVGHGCKWTISQLRNYFLQNSVDDGLLWHRVTNIIILTLLMQAPSAPKMRNCFELYGFDILIDSALKPWLLEVNFSPSLSSDCHADLLAKKTMLHDLLDIVYSPEPEPPLNLDFHRTRNVHRGDYQATHGSRASGLPSSRSITSVWSEYATSSTRKMPSGQCTLPPRPISGKHNKVTREQPRQLRKILQKERLPVTKKSTMATSKMSPKVKSSKKSCSEEGEDGKEFTTKDVKALQTKEPSMYDLLKEFSSSSQLNLDANEACDRLKNVKFSSERPKLASESDSGVSSMSEGNHCPFDENNNTPMSKLSAETEFWERPLRTSRIDGIKSEENTKARSSPSVEQEMPPLTRKGSLVSIGARHFSHQTLGHSDAVRKKKYSSRRDLMAERFDIMTRLRNTNSSESRYSAASNFPSDNHSRNGLLPLSKTSRKRVGRFYLVFPFNDVTDQMVRGGKLETKVIIQELLAQSKELESELKSGVIIAEDESNQRIWSPLRKSETDSPVR